MKGKRRGRQKKSWKYNIKDWMGTDFASSTRAAEDRTRWKGTVANSFVVPQQPSKDMKYRKNSKNWDTLNYYRDCPTNGIVGFYSAILRSKDADRITNRVDTDQTAP